MIIFININSLVLCIQFLTNSKQHKRQHPHELQNVPPRSRPVQNTVQVVTLSFIWYNHSFIYPHKSKVTWRMCVLWTGLYVKPIHTEEYKTRGRTSTYSPRRVVRLARGSTSCPELQLPAETQAGHLDDRRACT